MRRMYRGELTLVVILVVLAIFLMSLFYVNRNYSLTRHQKAGFVRIGYAVEVPYAYLKHGGEVTGESPMVARRIAAKLGTGRMEWI